MRINILIFAFLVLLNQISAFGISTGICYSGCAAVVVACYSAAGFVFGTVTAGVGVPPAIIGCNAAFGACMAKCTVATALLP
jgi:hypothetical protein